MCFTAWAWGVMTWASAPTCPFRCQLLSKYFVHYLHSNSCITTPDASRILYWPYCRLSAAALFIFQVDNYLKSYFLVWNKISTLLSVFILENSLLTVTNALIAKFSISASYAIIRFYTSELLPEALRASYLTKCTLMARIGSVIAPFIIGVVIIIMSFLF